MNHCEFIAVGDRQIFSFYHSPKSCLVRNSAVLILNPWNDEYSKSHRALRHLAETLAENGFPVLRFDYYGTGDSGGELWEGRMGLWQEDATAAADYLRAKSGVKNIQVVGLRHGAAIAAMASQTIKPHNLILWDPVFNGKKWLTEMCQLRADSVMTAKWLHFELDIGSNDYLTETLGFPLTKAQLSDHMALDIEALNFNSEFLHIVSGDSLADSVAGVLPGAYQLHKVSNGDWESLESLRATLFADEATKCISNIVERPYNA